MHNIIFNCAILFCVLCPVLLHNSTARVDGTASTARIQQLEQEKQALQSRVDRMHQGMHDHESSVFVKS